MPLWKKKDNNEVPVIEEKMPDYSLFENTVRKGETQNAVIIGSNLLNQDPKNSEFFSRFFDWLCAMAVQSDDLLTKEGYYGLANDACSSFTLSMDLVPDNIALVTKCREKLKEVQQDRYNAQEAAEIKDRDENIGYNKKLLEKIKEYSDAAAYCETVEKLEWLSQTIVKCDRELRREYLPEMQDEYDDLMKEVSERISDRAQVLARKANLRINREAAKTYKEILEAFHHKESEYTKKDSDIRGFYNVLDEAFRYKESDLFPETLTYYSYVYNYIFTAVQESQKYYLTRHMIDAKGERDE